MQGAMQNVFSDGEKNQTLFLPWRSLKPSKETAMWIINETTG